MKKIIYFVLPVLIVIGHLPVISQNFIEENDFAEQLQEQELMKIMDPKLGYAPAHPPGLLFIHPET